MAQGATTNLALQTQETNDVLPEEVVKDNFETIDSYVTAVKWTNRSAAGVVAGDVVVVATANDNSFTTTTTANATKVLGVVQETVAVGSSGIVKVIGSTTVRVTAATSRGDWLVTSVTAGQASPTTATNPPNGAFAIALTSSGGAGTVTAALFHSTVTQTIALPASAAPTPTTDGVLEWDSDDNRIVAGNGAAQTTFYSGQTTGWVLVGVNTAEQTDASAAAMNLVSITLNAAITAATPMCIVFQFRKGAGAAAIAYLGLRLNATTVFEASAAAFVAQTTNVSQAEDGWCEIYIGPRETNYRAAVMIRYVSRVSATLAAGQSNAMLVNTATALPPTASITDVVIRANSTDAAQTVAVKNVYVYALGTGLA